MSAIYHNSDLSALERYLSIDILLHCARVAAYSDILFHHCIDADIYLDELDAINVKEDDIPDIVFPHDVGKCNVPASILNAPYRLNPQEFEYIKNHTRGIEVIIPRVIVEHDLTKGDSLGRHLENIITVATQHHERWDGMGYPHGIKGYDINILARLCSVCDVLDAMTYPRVYKQSCSIPEAIKEIQSCGGRQLDPLLAEAAVDCQESFAELNLTEITYIRVMLERGKNCAQTTETTHAFREGLHTYYAPWSVTGMSGVFPDQQSS